MRSAIFLGLAAAMATTGCVSKKKYAELESMYDSAVQERDEAYADRDKAKDRIEEMQARNRARLEAFASVYTQLIQIQEQGLAKVRIDDGKAVLQLESDVLFASGSANLTDSGRKTVQDIAAVLKVSPARFQVEGHTDTDPIKSKEFPTNWHLGGDRAINVVLAMTEAGMSADHLSAASYGQYAPVADNTSKEGKQENRRIELVWMPELSEVLPYKRMAKELEEKGGK